jgi:hypothetical protein
MNEKEKNEKRGLIKCNQINSKMMEIDELVLE